MTLSGQRPLPVARRGWSPPPGPLGSLGDPLRPCRCVDGHRSVCWQRSEAVTRPRSRAGQMPSEAGGGGHPHRSVSGRRPFLSSSPGRRYAVRKYAAPQDPSAWGPITAARWTPLPCALDRSPLSDRLSIQKLARLGGRISVRLTESGVFKKEPSSWGPGSRCCSTRHGLRSDRELCPAFRFPLCRPPAPAAGDTCPSFSKGGNVTLRDRGGRKPGVGPRVPKVASACASTSHTPRRGVHSV